MPYQQGSIYLHNDTWYLKYRITELANGTPTKCLIRYALDVAT